MRSILRRPRIGLRKTVCISRPLRYIHLIVKPLQTAMMNSELKSATTPRSFNPASLAKGMLTLCLCPHPDDFDSIAITLRHIHEAGGTMRVCVMRTGSGVENVYCSPPTWEVKAAIREKEQRASCAAFGLPAESLEFLDIEEDDGENPVESERNIETVGGRFRRIAPDIVFLPHGNDSNKGHRTIYRIFAGLAARAGKPLTAFLIKDAKTLGMRVDVYTPFEKDEAEWKASLLRLHDSQQSRNLRTRGFGFDKRVLDVNRNTARELGLVHEFAEAFEMEQWNSGKMEIS